MAVEYIDDLAAEINHAGIGQLEKVEPGVWDGTIDATCIICHDETPQFINHGDSSYTTTKVFGVAGERSETLTKSNRESVTVHPFSNLAGEMLCLQVIFSGAGLTNQMAPEASEKIPNMLVTVNKSGVSDHNTLLDAYKLVDSVLTEKEVPRPVIVVADGHGSRFDETVLSFLQESLTFLFILHPDALGGTQLQDQMNGRLHSLYDQNKEELYTTISTLNRQCFMNILSESWADFAAPELLCNAGRRVGLSNVGLNINWMNQEMFAQAEALRLPSTPPHKKTTTVQISSPIGPRRYSLEWYKHKLSESMKVISDLTNTSISIEDVDGILPLKKIQPAKEDKKQTEAGRKVELRAAFLKCTVTCSCSSKCVVSGLKQCPNCLDVLKSQCSKSACMVDGQKPIMITPATSKTSKNIYSKATA